MINDEIAWRHRKEITHLASSGNYTWIHLKNQPPYLSSKTLARWDNLLSDLRFVRISRSILINLDCITEVEKIPRKILTVWIGDQLFPVSRRKRSETFQVYYHYKAHDRSVKTA